jgi:hypothetical protein
MLNRNRGDRLSQAFAAHQVRSEALIVADKEYLDLVKEVGWEAVVNQFGDEIVGGSVVDMEYSGTDLLILCLADGRQIQLWADGTIILVGTDGKDAAALQLITMAEPKVSEFVRAVNW